MENDEKIEKQKSNMEKLKEILNREYKIPNVKSNFFVAKRHIDACQVLKATVIHIKKNDRFIVDFEGNGDSNIRKN